MMELIVTEPWHLHSLHGTIGNSGPNIMTKIEDFVRATQTGIAVTMMEDGLPVGASGVIPHWKGVGELWALFSDQFREKPFTLHKVSIRALNYFTEHGEFRRLQCIVEKDFEAGLKWVRLLGFECEGLLREYGLNKEDYYRFARLF